MNTNKTKKTKTRFKIYCDTIGFKIPKSMVNTSLGLDEHEQNLIHIQFNDVISPQDFFELWKTIRENKSYELKVNFSFDLLEYRKDHVADFIKFLSKNKPKYNSLANINFEKNLKMKENFVFEIITTDENFYNKSQTIIKNLEETLKKYGFKRINLNLIYKEMVVGEIFQTQNVLSDEEKTKQFLEMLSKQQQNIEIKSNSFPQYRKKWSRKQYEKVKLSALVEMPSNSNVQVTGQIFDQSFTFSKNQKNIYSFSLTDYTEAIELRWFLNEPLTEKQLEELKNDSWVTFNGTISNNNFIYIDNYEPAQAMIEDLEDNSPLDKKRIELHISSKMNTMDSLIQPEEIIQQAEKFKMPAVSIMDVDSVQGFPKFYLEAVKRKIKPIFGVALSTISKENNVFYGNGDLNRNIKNCEYVSFDIETTGLSPKFSELIEYGAVPIDENFRLTNRIQFFTKTKNKLSAFTTDLTGINDQMIEENGIDIKEGLQRIYDNLNNKIALAHNATFDFHFLQEKFREHNMNFPNVLVIDTLVVSRMVFPDNKKHRLENIAHRLGIEYDPDVAHRGDYDAEVLAKVWIELVNLLTNNKITTLNELKNYCPEELYNRVRANEISVIAKNQKGLDEQFLMISKCLTNNYFNGPKTFIEDLPNYKNVLIGSGTLKGKLLDAYFFGSHELFLKEIEKYDYIEIPAPQVLSHYVENGSMTKENIEFGLKEIILEAKKRNKLVIATGDVKYIHPIDQKAYEVVVYAKGIKNSRHYLYDYRQARLGRLKIPKQHFLTTKQMIDQFAFLNDKKLIEEIVIINTHKLADMIENIKVIKDGLFTPKFDNSAVKLKELVYENAHKKYGEVLPELIQKRINDELNPIIKYGFDVIYWISHILVKKSTDNGFIVGSRGSVGSSFVATMSGISEVNPLPPHYLCNKCKHFELSEDKNITSGFDLPSKKCTKCNIEMERDGQSIPFETFLGFNADKVPDIDLNFSGEFQGQIHAEVRRLFGDDFTFKAGTVLTVKDKIAFGHVKAYAEETHQNFSNYYTNFLAKKLEKLKRTTSQHPGGIIIIPKEYDVLNFTPFGYPANEKNAEWKTTHFDYHSIDSNVLKLDILGHDNPTIIKLLEKYTGININQIPKNDQKVMSIFTSPKALGIKPEDICGEKTGALGIPEFGTSFVRQMLIQAQPKSFANLISLSGLSHGENVWLNNAKDLIMEKGFKIDDVISCRDDILNMLIKQGVPSDFSFKIMEKVRKGKGLTLEEEDKLKEYKTPEWQIQSMKKIKYMFPKAHATAYVLMAWWISWYKVFHPLAFYASYLSAHARATDIQNMVDIKNGSKALNRLRELLSISQKDLKAKDKDLINMFLVVQEMYARGFNISNIDLKRSDSHEWIIDQKNQCLIPPFDAIDGLGGAAAESIVNARNEKEFISVEDFTRRTSVNKTLVNKMEDLNIFKGLSTTDQIKLF
ncbi:PolC-type DNA polymerase III [Mycoplasmopsis lipofaciens]|uniref:PolC-type DNA polymerase III n=1 Tax=Mycoplasmopsis lipofaciens TaxID=114884 RepID=UPI0004820397|nr:PolC-type DNA polymerase III [Mycoplasmopsis lipofaciens]